MILSDRATSGRRHGHPAPGAGAWLMTTSPTLASATSFTEAAPRNSVANINKVLPSVYWLYGISVRKQAGKELLAKPFPEVDKEEMIEVVVITSAFLERIVHVADTMEILSSHHRW